MWKRLIGFLFVMGMTVTAHADNLFSTAWGRSLDTSPEGKLFFIALECFGIWTAIKALRLMYLYANGRQHRYGTIKCLVIFLIGCVFYFPHHALNVIYNSFH